MVAVLTQRTLVEEFRSGNIGLSNGVAEIDADEAVRYQNESCSDCVCLLSDALMNLTEKSHRKMDALLVALMNGSITFDGMNDLRDLLRSSMTEEAQRALNKELQPDKIALEDDENA